MARRFAEVGDLIPLAALLFCWSLLALPGLTADTTAAPPTHDTELTASPAVRVGAEQPAEDQSIAITITSAEAGNLFRAGRPFALSARIANPDTAQTAAVTTRIATGFGALVYTHTVDIELPAQGAVDLPIAFEGSNRLPRGSYRVEVWAQSERSIGYRATTASIWDGPAASACDAFGISYAGPLTGDSTWRDLDLLRQAGVGWLRFPMQGWLPQGDAAPPEAEVYNQFVQEAGKRGFSLLAAFTPRTTADPATDPTRAEKEFYESLLAAATRYAFKVKYWEMGVVKPDPRYPELKGTRYSEIMRAREALRRFDKSLAAVYGVNEPFPWNALELFQQGAPAKGDLLGMRYNFIGLPETVANPTPPVPALEDVRASARKSLKNVPPVWITEYGFDPSIGERLPSATQQAALISRAIILARAAGVQRTFWRHKPDEQFDLPFVRQDGSALPSLLAVRTTLAMLNGVTSITPVAVPLDMRQGTASGSRVFAFLLAYGKRGGSLLRGKTPARTVLAVWGENQPDPLTIRTAASQITVTDLWGNAIELRPAANTALFQADEFPRFLDLGAYRDVELSTPFAFLRPAQVILRDGGDNTMRFELINDQRYFTGKVTYDVHFRRWPGGDEVQTVRQLSLDPYGRHEVTSALAIPEGAVKGQLYDISVEIMLGTRRIGYLTLPVWYLPGAPEPGPEALPKSRQ